MSAGLHADSGTCKVTQAVLTRTSDRKSLPTQVHVRPSHINCNSLRSDYSLTKFCPAVLNGNWNEQRIFDEVNTVDPNPKSVALHFQKVESMFYDSKRPPTLGDARPRYETETSTLYDWNQTKKHLLPATDAVKDTLGKPLHADVDQNMYSTSASFVGFDRKVRF